VQKEEEAVLAKHVMEQRDGKGADTWLANRLASGVLMDTGMAGGKGIVVEGDHPYKEREPGSRTHIVQRH
jgi:hypothetical protein